MKKPYFTIEHIKICALDDYTHNKENLRVLCKDCHDEWCNCPCPRTRPPKKGMIDC